MGGRLNISENLFIGTQEISAIQNYALDFSNILGILAKTFGFIENKDLIRLSEIEKEDRTCFKASSPGNLQLQFYTPSYAMSYPNKMISWTKNRIVTLPDSYKNKKYWVKISYAEDYIEEGTLRLDAQGNVIGTGTYFTDKLRGEPNFASRITLYTFNGTSFDEKGIYIVESVNSDTSISIYSETGTIGDITLNYYYAINGTFPIGSNITKDEQFPYRYDGCKVEFVEETTEGEAPNSYIMKNDNTSFYVARIIVDANGVIAVQDKRFLFEGEEEKFSKWFSIK